MKANIYMEESAIVEMNRQQRNAQARDTRLRNRALVAFARDTGLIDVAGSPAALYGALAMVAQSLVDPARRAEAEAIGEARLSQTAPPVDVLVQLPHVCGGEVEGALSERGLSSQGRLRGPKSSIWVGTAPVDAIRQIVVPLGGTVYVTSGDKPVASVAPADPAPNPDLSAAVDAATPDTTPEDPSDGVNGAGAQDERVVARAGATPPFQLRSAPSRPRSPTPLYRADESLEPLAADARWSSPAGQDTVSDNPMS